MKRYHGLIKVILAGLIVSLAAVPASEAKDKDLTAPLLTCGIIGQLVQDAAISLGPVRRAELPPASLPASSAERLNKLPSLDGSRKKNGSALQPAPSKQQQLFKRKTFEPQTYLFSGEQIWGKAEATVVTAERTFDVKVKCTLPVTLWAVFADGAQIASESVPSLTSLSFKVKELYTPPYVLVINVIYMGMANQIRIELK